MKPFNCLMSNKLPQTTTYYGNWLSFRDLTWESYKEGGRAGKQGRAAGRRPDTRPLPALKEALRWPGATLPGTLSHFIPMDSGINTCLSPKITLFQLQDIPAAGKAFPPEFPRHAWAPVQACVLSPLLSMFYTTIF